MRRPFFSIVIPTYNRAESLRFAIYCILRQSFRDFEIIVSDNCSTDNTNEIIRSLKDTRIRYFRNKTNVGSTGNVKKAIERGKGKYIFIHGDDDFILQKSALHEVYLKINKFDLGFIRLNYIARTPNKKQIFVYHGKNPYPSDHYLPMNADNNEVLSFILDSDNGFMTGIIFKNELPSKVATINSDYLPWVSMLFYTSKQWGAYYISKPHIIASWSVWRPNRSKLHIMFSLIDGKLATENFLNFVRTKLNEDNYKNFLRNHLLSIYVTMFPAIKFYVGNGNMLRLVARARELDKGISGSGLFWIYLTIGIIFPRNILNLVRIAAFNRHVKFSKIADKERILNSIKILERNYAKNF